MSQFIIAIVRTVVPYVVGWVVTQLALMGIGIPQPIVDDLIGQLTILVGSLYYIAVAWLERKWSWFGWLLGVARKPVYEPRHAA